jgi:serine/threonine protein phosphatase PrpC
MIEPALSGSCAVSMLVDEEREELYVASTGDCRAVAGYWVQGQAGKGGKWRCEVLTEDQMGKNPNEVKRWVCSGGAPGHRRRSNTSLTSLLSSQVAGRTSGG